ncbi:DUF3375 family protein [Spirosoma panaciterrae]|uniref:DUF3375 family protein n=1 Tax=Spirosoma panaciterrae TaxID=496058 RepID=UPI00035C59D6|nr:DUF3375 family protein [Spirosoma panaciterrae]
MLAQKLEKIIAEKHLRDRRKSLTLINEIRTLAFTAMDNPPRDDAFLEIDGKADYVSSDPFVSLQERESRIEPRVLAIAETEETNYESLVNQYVIDKSVLLANVKYRLRSQTQVTLREVIDEFGLKYGLAELMAYGSLAAASTKHLINDNQQDSYMIGENRRAEFPEIIFCR